MGHSDGGLYGEALCVDLAERFTENLGGNPGEESGRRGTRGELTEKSRVGQCVREYSAGISQSPDVSRCV